MEAAGLSHLGRGAPQESGFYYLQSRYYDPSIGRFINADAAEYSEMAAYSLADTNLFAYCCNNPVNLTDDGGNLPSWATKVIVAAGVVTLVAVVAAVTVATAGAGTAAAMIAVGAAKGAAIGMATGAVAGAGSAAANHLATTGSLKGSKSAVLDGMGNGALSGAVTGALTGAASNAVKVVKAVKSWSNGTFKSSYQSMNYHYKKHGLFKGNNVLKYTQDATNFARQNSSMLRYTCNYKYNNMSWNWSYTSSRGGMYTSNGKILTFWYR